jgi:hypothetical protein
LSCSLEFPYRHSYESRTTLTVPLTLLSDPSRWIDVIAAIDTSSTFNIFERKYGEALELDVESGLHNRIATATGYFYCYGHELTLSIFDLEWQAVVYFAESDAFLKSVVGRVGFLDRSRVGIIDYEQLLYLGLYDERVNTRIRKRFWNWSHRDPRSDSRGPGRSVGQERLEDGRLVRNPAERLYGAMTSFAERNSNVPAFILLLRTSHSRLY